MGNLEQTLIKIITLYQGLQRQTLLTLKDLPYALSSEACKEEAIKFVEGEIPKLDRIHEEISPLFEKAKQFKILGVFNNETHH